MKPVDFRESNKVLRKPESMTDEECGSLPIHNTKDGQCISCWKLSLKERLNVLFGGVIWLGVCSGITQPPVWISSVRPFEPLPKPKRGERMINVLG